MEMSRKEAIAACERSLLVLPVGATEQHGDHLPVGTDTLLVEAIVERAASMTSGVVVLPTVTISSSPHHLPFGGTLSLTSVNLYRLLRDIGSSLKRSRCRCLFIVNGHGGNHELIQVAARDIALEEGFEVASVTWWVMAMSALRAAAPPGTRIPGHAGAFETSTMLAIDRRFVAEAPSRDSPDEPPLTQESAFRVESPGRWENIDGFTDDPSVANADLGLTYLEIGAKELSAAFTALNARVFPQRA